MNINKFSKLRVLGTKLVIKEKPYKDKTYLHPCEAILYNNILYLTFRHELKNIDVCISAEVTRMAQEEILSDGSITIHYVSGRVNELDIAPTGVPGYNIMMRLMLFRNGEIQGVFGRSHIYSVDVRRMGACAKVSLYINKNLHDEEKVGPDEYLINDALEIYEIKEQLNADDRYGKDWDMTTYDLDYGVRRTTYIRKIEKLNKYLVTIEEMEV